MPDKQQQLILVIDDHKDILDVLEIVLKMKQYKVVVKQEMKNFLSSVREINPDLILLDKSLGWADGCELCAALKEDMKLSKIPVVIFSAHHHTRERAFAAGANAFIEKPYDIHHLTETLAVFLPDQ